MSRLNETYSEMTKDVAKMLVPMMGKIDTKGFNAEAFDVSKVVMMTMGLVGDLLETIDEMDKKQKFLEGKINCLIEANNSQTKVLNHILAQADDTKELVLSVEKEMLKEANKKASAKKEKGVDE